jgi:hypothetical protein
MKYFKHTLAFALPLAALLAADIAAAQNQQLQNPLTINDISGFISLVLKVMVMVALPIISFFIVYSGFLFISAQGNQEALSKAKTNLLYVLIGSVLILGAWVISTLIGGTVTQLVR